MNKCITSFECSGSNGCRYFTGNDKFKCIYVKQDNHGVHTCTNVLAKISASNNATSKLLQERQEKMYGEI